MSCTALLPLGLACASAAPPPEAPTATAPVPTTPLAAEPPTPPPPAPPEAPTAAAAEPAALAPDPEQAALEARATGPATGGPRGARPCAFHESVDSYQRQCSATVEADGSVRVVAKGTKLNPDNGFDFTLHGGADNVWYARGTLNAFSQCSGPFVSRVSLSIDGGVKVYELRFKENCKIVVR